MTSPFDIIESTTTRPRDSFLHLSPINRSQVVNVPKAVARSLRNINPSVNTNEQDSTAETKVAAVYVDERGRTKLK